MIKLILTFFVIGVFVFFISFKFSLKIRLIAAFLCFFVPSILFLILLYNARDEATPGSRIIMEENINEQEEKGIKQQSGGVTP